MNEAIKIVKAKLNKALDRNDAKAVREACLELKAMEEGEIAPNDADARTINADVDYFVCDNPSDADARTVISDINKKLNEVKKDLIHVKEAYSVDIQAGLDKFVNDVK